MFDGNSVNVLRTNNKDQTVHLFIDVGSSVNHINPLLLFTLKLGYRSKKRINIKTEIVVYTVQYLPQYSVVLRLLSINQFQHNKLNNGVYSLSIVVIVLQSYDNWDHKCNCFRKSNLPQTGR